MSDTERTIEAMQESTSTAMQEPTPTAMQEPTPADPVAIVRTWGTCGGEPRLDGHRLTVWFFRGHREHIDYLKENWPYLTDAQIAVAFAWLDAHPEACFVHDQDAAEQDIAWYGPKDTWHNPAAIQRDARVTIDTTGNTLTPDTVRASDIGGYVLG